MCLHSVQHDRVVRRVKRMQNRDILFEVITKLDNEALWSFVHTSLWDTIKNLIDNRFWYVRSQNVVGMSLQARLEADWKKIYYTLVLVRRYRGERFQHGLDYLPSLLVMVEVYGTPDCDQDMIWESVEDPEVLRYLLSVGYLKQSLDSALDSLVICAEEGRVSMIEALLDIIQPTHEDDLEAIEGDIMRAIRIAARSSYLEIVKLIVTRNQIELSRYDLNYIVEESDYDTTLYLLDKYEFDKSILMQAVSIAISSDNVEALKAFLDRGISKETVREIAINEAEGTNVIELLIEEKIGPTNEEWKRMLLASVKLGCSEMVEYIIKHVPQSTTPYSSSLIDKLRRAGGLLSNDAVFEVVRQQPILGYSALGTLKTNQAVAESLVRDSKPEEWDIYTLRVFFWELRVQDSDSLSGFISRGSLASGWGGDLTVVEEENTYAFLLRIIFIKHPSGGELLNWMIKRRDKKLQLAARSIVERKRINDPEVMPLRALMLCIVYPTMRLDEIIATMAGMSSTGIKRAIQLVGAYLGGSSPRM